MKKASGVCLILLGSLIFIFCGYGFCSFMMTNKEKFIARYAETGRDATTFYEEGIDTHIRNGRIKTGLLTLLGAIIVLGGVELSRKASRRIN